MDRDAPVPFEVVDDVEVLHTFHFDVRRLTLRGADGTFVRDIEVHRGAAAAVALTADGRIALVRQYRVPLRRWTWELPAGGVLPGEDPSVAAVRELTEETGLLPGHVEPLLRFVNSPGHSTQWTTIVLATGCTAGPRQTDGPEEALSSAHLVTPEEADRLVAQGAIVDAKSLLGLAALRARSELRSAR